MTVMTKPLAGRVTGPEAGAPWTVSDLFDLPDDGFRYEIFDGSLVVTPPPATPHIFVTTDPHHLMMKAAPTGFTVAEGAGIFPSEKDYFIPDLMVLNDASRRGDRLGFRPDEVLLAVEVISPGNPSHDLVTKRHHYAKFGIRHYWIADPRTNTLRILALNPESSSYDEVAVLRPGDSWDATEPFPVTVDPAQIFAPRN